MINPLKIVFDNPLTKALFVNYLALHNTFTIFFS